MRERIIEAAHLGVSSAAASTAAMAPRALSTTSPKGTALSSTATSGSPPRAVDAQRGEGAEALDAQLPGIIVEADDRLPPRPRRQIGERRCEIAEDARRVTIGNSRGDVGAVEEDVEHLARGEAPSRGAHRLRRFEIAGFAGGEEIGLGGDDDFESHGEVRGPDRERPRASCDGGSRATCTQS